LIKLNIISVEDCYSDSVRLKLTDSENELKFSSGQFITIVLFYNKYLFKSFSIASSPFELPTVELVFRNNDDDFTKAVLQMNSCDLIWSLPSEGKLTMTSDARNNIVFIAMGSGITPFMSIIKDELHKKNSRNMLLFYANRNFNTAYFIDELQNFDKPFELMIYPNQRHGIRNPKFAHSVKLDVDFWFRKLLDK